MHFDHLSSERPASLPRLDDDDDDEPTEEAVGKKSSAPVALLVQRKILEQRKVFLWGAVTDETAKDITEKLLYLEATGAGKDITFTSTRPAARSRPAWRSTTRCNSSRRPSPW